MSITFRNADTDGPNYASMTVRADAYCHATGGPFAVFTASSNQPRINAEQATVLIKALQKFFSLSERQKPNNPLIEGDSL